MSAESERLEHLARRVARAWNEPGVRPDIHRHHQSVLARQWPMLTQAIADLADEVESIDRARRG